MTDAPDAGGGDLASGAAARQPSFVERRMAQYAAAEEAKASAAEQTSQRSNADAGGNRNAGGGDPQPSADYVPLAIRSRQRSSDSCQAGKLTPNIRSALVQSRTP